ncbi:MAG: DUF4445 domain-containing protein, partial [Gemmatimonadetes bacterium]|nr:DUF4445 domain-containing protein [Gemmatimonadota bacterium]
MSPLHHAGRELELVRGKSLFDYADELGLRLPASCGRAGDCHECIVEVLRGMEALTPPAAAEAFLSGSYRLACQARVTSTDANIEFASLRRQAQILTRGMRREFSPEPLTVRRGHDVFYLGGPGGSRDPERVGRWPGGLYGVALDAGTTTVVANLVDLERARTVYTASFENPQCFGGSDVMHRISYDTGPFRGELKAAIISRLNFEIGDMCGRTGIPSEHICEMVVVGNSTMRDIFFGLDVRSIGLKPFRSVTEYEFERGERESTALSVNAGELGVAIRPEATVYGAPLIGSHVGADAAAGVLAVGMDEEDETVMFVDVGTNTEVVVGNRHRLLAASCPAGPAFEGGGIAFAMPGYEGAVERLSLRDGSVEYRTIADKPPQGICGSGLIDLLAELRRTGRMSEMGAFTDGSAEFAFVPEKGMTLSRTDVSALAQAKAANYSGQSI